MRCFLTERSLHFRNGTDGPWDPHILAEGNCFRNSLWLSLAKISPKVLIPAPGRIPIPAAEELNQMEVTGGQTNVQAEFQLTRPRE